MTSNKPKHPALPTKIARRLATEARVPVQKIAYSLQELEGATSLSVDFLRIEIRKGNLRAFKVGARVVVLAADFEAYLVADKIKVGGAD